MNLEDLTIKQARDLADRLEEMSDTYAASDERFDAIRLLRALSTGIEQSPAVEATCATCKGSGEVDDGEITGSGGVEFENGPIRCVKDCPECIGKRQVVKTGAGARDDEALLLRICEEAEGPGVGGL